MAYASTQSPPKSDANKNRNKIPISRFLKTVCLSDWWLLKAENDSEGGGLSVSGFTSREQRAMRVFSSAPILKSHDMFTLETTDGICVLIKGFINKARTLENGFPSDVFNHFVFGFPPYWKEYAEKCMGGHSYVDSKEMGDGTLSACHLNNENRVTKGRATLGSCSKLQRIHENNRISDRISVGYKTRSKSVLPSDGEKVQLESVNFELRDRNNLHCGDIGFKEPVEMSETPYQDKNRRKAKNKGSMDQAMDKGTRSKDWHDAAHKGTRSKDWHDAAHKEKEHALANESSIFDKDGTSKMKARRKLAYETPGRDKEEVLSGSSKSLSFSRSRSGRLLMPILQFWRNERAIYDAEGSITGIEEEIFMNGKNGRPQKRRRNLV